MNPGPFAPESCTLTTRLPSHHFYVHCLITVFCVRFWYGKNKYDDDDDLTLCDLHRRFDLLSRFSLGSWYYAEYSTFTVLPEAYSYELRAGGYSGNIKHSVQKLIQWRNDGVAAASSDGGPLVVGSPRQF